MNTGKPVNHKNMGPAAGNMFWAWDRIASYPMTFRLRLDAEIDGSLLLEAFRETLSVWPVLLDAYIEEEDGNIYLAEDQDPVIIHHTPEIVAPGGGRNGNRTVALSYDGDWVSLTGLHSFLDGGSLKMILFGTVTRYLCRYYGIADTGLDLPKPGEGKAPENSDFYLFRKEVWESPYRRTEPIWTSEDPYEDARTKNQPFGSPLVPVRIRVPKEAFLSYCRKYGANPSVMLLVLCARAVYRLHPEEMRPFTGTVTIDLRKVLGIPMSIIGASSSLPVEVTRKDLEERELGDVCRQTRRVLDEKRSRDAILSRADDIMKQVPFENSRYTFRLTYLGEMAFGAAAAHVRDVYFYLESWDTVIMLAYGGQFMMDFQLGEASRDYADEVCAILREEGVDAAHENSDSVVRKVVR